MAGRCVSYTSPRENEGLGALLKGPAPFIPAFSSLLSTSLIPSSAYTLEKRNYIQSSRFRIEFDGSKAFGMDARREFGNLVVSCFSPSSVGSQPEMVTQQIRTFESRIVGQ